MYNSTFEQAESISIFTAIFFTDGLINLPGKSGVRCTGYTNLCSAAGNSDFRLDINVTACPATTTTIAGTTTTTPTTTTQPTTTLRGTCTCSTWTDVTPCTATCGASTRQQSRTCTNCSPIMPVIVRTVPCQVTVSWFPWLLSTKAVVVQVHLLAATTDYGCTRFVRYQLKAF